MPPGVENTSSEEVSPTSPRSPEADGGQGDGTGSTARRGVRTVVLSVVALVGLAGLAIGTLFTSLGPSERPAPGAGPAIGGPAISGTVSLASELRGRLSEGETLFIIAHKGPGPPFAVKRVIGPHFPLTYRLGPEDVMAAGMPFEGEVSISARLSQSGTAGPAQPSDLEGEHPGRVAVGAQGVDVVITQVR